MVSGRVREIASGDTIPAAAVPAGGADPWTYVEITQDFTVAAITFADVLVAAGGAVAGFTPAANTDYTVEGMLLVQTATATNGPRPGLAWGTGYQYGAAKVSVPTSAAAEAFTHATIGTGAGTCQAPVGGLPVINTPYLSMIFAQFRSGASPTAFRLQLAAETAANVTIKAGSWIRYRTT